MGILSLAKYAEGAKKNFFYKKISIRKSLRVSLRALRETFLSLAKHAEGAKENFFYKKISIRKSLRVSLRALRETFL